MRTPREFSEAGMVLRVLCRCGHEKRVDPLEIEFTHGEDFDLAYGRVALAADMRCEACGDKPVIALREAEPVRREPTGPYTDLPGRGKVIFS